MLRRKHQEKAPDGFSLTQKPYNPLELPELAESMVQAFLKREVISLNTVRPFDGAGIYALYYVGNFEPYLRFAKQNRNGKWNQPFYIGEALKPGARKGGMLSSAPAGNAIYKRLLQHIESINAAQNLKIEHFGVRYLVAEDVFIPLCESLLIDRYNPIWNTTIEGFGIHVTGGPRSQQQASKWDTLHPGRLGRGQKQNIKYPTAASVIALLKSVH
jgi:hypothetical protein